MLHHCWNFLVAGSRLSLYRRKMAACGVTRRDQDGAPATVVTKRAHGPFVGDNSEWYVVDEADCPGLGLIELNPEPVVVPDKTVTQADC